MQIERKDMQGREQSRADSRQQTAEAGWVRLAEGNSDTKRARLFSDEEQKRGQQFS